MHLFLSENGLSSVMWLGCSVLRIVVFYPEDGCSTFTRYVRLPWVTTQKSTIRALAAVWVTFLPRDFYVTKCNYACKWDGSCLSSIWSVEPKIPVQVIHYQYVQTDRNASFQIKPVWTNCHQWLSALHRAEHSNGCHSSCILYSEDLELDGVPSHQKNYGIELNDRTASI